MEDTVSRYEDIAKELETMREVDEAHRAKIKELQFNLDEREIQLRAITEAKGMSDKRSTKAEQAYEVLAINCNELKEFLEKKSKSYDSHVQKLDKTIAGLVHDRDTLLAEKGKVIAELEINQNSISELSKKNLTLEQKLREAEKRNILLADTTIERNRIQEEKEALQTQVVKLEKRASEASSMAEKSAHEIAMLQEAASSLRSEIATEQHSRAKIQEKKTELEHTLEAQIHENEAKSSLFAVLQSTITAYKCEIQRLISDQANGERNYTDASNRLTEFETRLGSSEFTRSELKKQVDRSRLQTKQIAEVTTRFQTKVAEQARTIDSLSKENKKLVEKHENLRECCNQLKVLIEQRKHTEDEQRKEVTEIRGLNRMQGDVINDLEGVICDLRSKISGYQHDKRSAGATTASRIEVTQLETVIQTLQQEAAVSKVAFRAELRKLEGAMQKLREEAAFSEETIDALEYANRALEEENVSFRQQGRVNAQSSKRDDCVIKELAQINCENLIRINELLESQAREITKVEQEATRLVCEKVAMTNGVESLSRALQKALDRNSDLQSNFEEATGKVNTLCKRQREIEDECVSIQTVNGELRKHLLEQQEDAEREKALKESYQQEVGRLQTAKSELLNTLECHEMTKKDTSARSVEEKMKKAEIRTPSESLQTAMACNSDLQKRLEEANEKVRTLSERQRETEGELESMQLATTSNMESLSKSLQEALEHNSNLQNSLEEANEKVRSLSERQRETEGELESMQLATIDKIELLSANHQMSKERILVLQSDLEDAQEKVKMHVKRHKEIESRVESIQHVNDELRKLLLEKEEEAKKEVALKKSYENEVGRLLDANAEFLKLQDHFADKEEEAARFADEKLVMSNEVASLSSTLQKSLEQIVALQRDAEEANQDAKSLFAQKRAIEDQLASTQTVNSELQNHLLEQKGEAEKENVLNKSYQIEVGRLLKAQSTLHDELDHLRAQNDELLHQMTQLEKVHAMYEQNSIESSHKVANILATINSEVCGEKFEGQNGKSCQGTLTFDEDCFANCANIESLVKNIVVLEERIAALTVKYRHLLEEADSLRITITDQSVTIERLQDIVGRLESERKSSEPSQGADELMEIAMIAAQYTSAQPSSDPGFSPAIERSYIRDHLALTLTEVFENQHSQIKSLKEQLFVTVGKVADFHRERDEFNAVIQTLRLENNILITAGKDRDKRASKRQQKLYDENRALRESIGDLTQQTKDHQLKIMQLAAKQAALQRKKADALDVGLAEVLNQHTQVSGRDEQSSALTRGAQTPDIGSVEVVLVEESRDEQ
jgi:chromosome segregation ATPase